MEGARQPFKKLAGEGIIQVVQHLKDPDAIKFSLAEPLATKRVGLQQGKVSRIAIEAARDWPIPQI